MILLDTSAIYALADASDPNHPAALRLLTTALEEQEPVVLHSCILDEAAALIQGRIGLDTSLRFLQDMEQFQVHWITATDHQRAVELLAERRRRGLSLVDCTSFILMRILGIQQAIAFDADFIREGFALYGPLSRYSSLHGRREESAFQYLPRNTQEIAPNYAIRERGVRMHRLPGVVALDTVQAQLAVVLGEGLQSMERMIGEYHPHMIRSFRNRDTERLFLREGQRNLPIVV